jgi:hypothetical protein
MKILHIKFNGILSLGHKEQIQKQIDEVINKGILVHDDSFEVNVLEFDKIKVEK